MLTQETVIIPEVTTPAGNTFPEIVLSAPPVVFELAYYRDMLDKAQIAMDACIHYAQQAARAYPTRPTYAKAEVSHYRDQFIRLSCQAAQYKQKIVEMEAAQ
jgi:hypothetical protein